MDIAIMNLRCDAGFSRSASARLNPTPVAGQLVYFTA
jgi:hypothetical protein